MAEARTKRRKVWITRTEPGAARTADKVAALGFEPIVAPLLTIQPTGAALELQPFEALALTSSQVVAMLGPDVPREALVFAVGETTARAARAAGFTKVISADGDVKALSETILKARALAVVHAAAARTAGDLAGMLAQQGLSTRRVVVYRAEPVRALPEAVIQAWTTAALGALLVHSPRAARSAAALVRRAGLAPRDVMALGLSPACLQPLVRRGFAGQAAAAPTEAALMALLAGLWTN